MGRGMGETTDELAALDHLVAERGITGWCLPAERYLLYHLARHGPGAGAIVEIGSWTGLSTAYLAAGSKAGGRERVTAIDPFAPDTMALFSDAPAPASLLDAFQANMRAVGVADWVTPITALAEQAARTWDNRPIRLLYIDGDHAYDHVCRDFADWRDWIAPEGLVAFHDALEPRWPGVARFLDEVLLPAGWRVYQLAAAPPTIREAPPLSTIVVAQRPGATSVGQAFPGGQGPFVTQAGLVQALRLHHQELLAQHQELLVLRQVRAVAEESGAYARRLERRVRELERDHARLAESTKALDRALRRANPLKRPLGRLAGAWLRGSRRNPT